MSSLLGKKLLKKKNEKPEAKKEEEDKKWISSLDFLKNKINIALCFFLHFLWNNSVYKMIFLSNKVLDDHNIVFLILNLSLYHLIILKAYMFNFIYLL